MRGNRYTFRQWLLIIALFGLAFLTLLPFVMTVIMSQKTNGEILNSFWALPSELHPEYYADAFKFVWRYMMNSIVVGVSVVVATIFLSSLSGYVFARLEFGGKKTLFIMILSLMMVPGLLTLVPSFLWYKEFPLIGGNSWLGEGGNGFLNTRWVLIIPMVAGGQIFGIFLCRTFFETIPNSLFEAARIDGASEFQAYWFIGVPLSLPILATLGIMQFVGSYNDFVWPSVTIRNDLLQVFSVGVTKFGAEGNLDMGPQLAGYMIGAIPLILTFAFGMKYYVEGLTSGAVKG